MFKRMVLLPKAQSFFLFGARGTGKSSLLRDHFQKNNTLWFDLLNPELEERLSLHPLDFRDEILQKKPRPQWIVVDEIQKVPKLLNLVHQLIEEQKFLFALTGSSGRRLKQKGANLLAGRAVLRHLFPLSSHELSDDFNLRECLELGSQPARYSLKTQQEQMDYLRAYCIQYIQHEIRAEQWVRKLDPFRRFLRVAAQMNGKILNYSNIANDVGADLTTVQSYFEILEDTYFGFMLPGHHRSIRKQQRQAPKFYFFDPGIKRALDQTLDVPMKPGTSSFGEAFEHWVILEAYRNLAYSNRDFSLSYLRTKDHAEVDLIVETHGRVRYLIEIKSTERADPMTAAKLERFLKDFSGAQAIVLSRDPLKRKFGKVGCLPWHEGLKILQGA